MKNIDKNSENDSEKKILVIENLFIKNKVYKAIKKLESVSDYNSSISSSDLNVEESNKRFVLYQKIVQEIVDILNNSELNKCNYVKKAKEKLERFLKYNKKVTVSSFDELRKKINFYDDWFDEVMRLLFDFFINDNDRNIILFAKSKISNR